MYTITFVSTHFVCNGIVTRYPLAIIAHCTPGIEHCDVARCSTIQVCSLPSHYWVYTGVEPCWIHTQTLFCGVWGLTEWVRPAYYASSPVCMCVSMSKLKFHSVRLQSAYIPWTDHKTEAPWGDYKTWLDVERWGSVSVWWVQVVGRGGGPVSSGRGGRDTPGRLPPVSVCVRNRTLLFLVFLYMNIGHQVHELLHAKLQEYKSADTHEKLLPHMKHSLNTYVSYGGPRS